MGKHLRQGDEPPAILRPALDDWQIVKIGVLYDFLRRGDHNITRSRSKKSSHHRRVFDECFCRRRNGLFKKRNELFAKCVRLFIERKFNTPFARQRVNDEGIFGTLYFFKQDRGFLFLQRAGGNLGDFKNGVDFNADAVEFTVFFEVVDKFTKGSKTHTSYSSSSFRQPFDFRSPMTPRSLSVKAATYSSTVFGTK